VVWESETNDSGLAVKSTVSALTEAVRLETFAAPRLPPAYPLYPSCSSTPPSADITLPLKASEMMMAHDSSPPPASGLAEETITRTRVSLSQYLGNPEAGGDELRLALDAMAGEARAKQMLPEQLLVVLKDIWYALPAVRSIDDAGAQIRLLQRVVTMCIKEYYR
jgi:hypothetical protein